ncbi:unnamed protein product [Effrenium voratum]|nr:unnamed protein product [Effrenium voratum]
MGQSGSTKADSWTGCWQQDSSDQESTQKIRVAEGLVTFEVHVAGQHALLCGELGGDWEPAPPPAAIFAVLAKAEGFDSDLLWRNCWPDGQKFKVLRTEIRPKDCSLETSEAQRVLRIDRQLQSGNMEFKASLVQGDTQSELSKFTCRLAEGGGPAPVAFLREFGLPLKTEEDRIQALDKVTALLKDIDAVNAISQAHETDRVPLPDFTGNARFLMGGIAFYKGLLPEWTRPEPIEDLAPPPLKQGVEAQWAVHNEPKGVCINIAPWNAPAMLSFGPMISMMAAGNHVVIKPPDLVPNVSAAVRKKCQQYLSGYVWVEEGGKEVVERLIDEGADHLAFTGGSEIAKAVAARCGKTLTPMTLELGGKSPAFIDQGLSPNMLKSIVLEICETKVFKAGQFCCAHDYALVHESIYADFCKAFEAVLTDLGTRRNVPLIGRRHYESIKKLLRDSGAECVPPLNGDFLPKDEEMAIPMTGLISPGFDKEVWTREIFGPLLPILRISGVEQAVETINRVGPKPLIAYCYTKDEHSEKAGSHGHGSWCP